MKGLLLAEKPSVMRAIREVYEKDPGILNGDVLDFGAFHGHLMELAPPDYYDAKNKKWTLEALPIIPKQFVYVPSDKASVDNLLNKIRSGGYDYLVNACDAGREGEHIFYSFYEANKLTIPVKRYWASDNTEVGIKTALGNLLDPKDTDGLRVAAKLRATFDWLTGINFSRAVSLVGGTKVNVGRVMSPTLKLIVDREKDIRSFVPKEFFEVVGTFSFGGEKYLGKHLRAPDFKNSRFDAQSEAKAVADKLTKGKTGVIAEVKKKHNSISAPTLYSLVELQKDADKYFHYRADRTLDIAQSLYEAGLLTYPRTESRALPTSMATEIYEHLKAIKEQPEFTKHVDGLAKSHVDSVMKDKTYVNDAKITDHHAIIPTAMPVSKSKKGLTSEEKNIYLLVAKRFLSIFMPPYETENTTVITDVDGLLFTTSGKVELAKGFTELYAAKTKDILLPSLKKGDKIEVVDGSVRGGKTQPPDRYTTKTLLEAMTNVSSQMTDAALRKILRDSNGIGTSATRADILKKLETTEMVKIQKNAFMPTDFGIAIIEAIGGRDICSALLTAKWEQKLHEIETGTYKGEAFKQEMIKFVNTETDDIISSNLKIQKALSGCNDSVVVVGTCPICGNNVFERTNTYCCGSYKPKDQRGVGDCDFAFSKKFFGATISRKEAEAILSGKETVEKKMISPKTKKQFSAAISLKREPGEDGKEICRVSPIFKSHVTDDVAPSTLKPSDFLGVCPTCGGKIYAGKNFYLCTNKSSGCGFSISKQIKGAEITPSEVKLLLSGKDSSSIVFKWNESKSGPAKLHLNETGKLSFKFN